MGFVDDDGSGWFVIAYLEPQNFQASSPTHIKDKIIFLGFEPFNLTASQVNYR